MGAPVPEMEAVENESAEALLSSLKTIGAKERRKHASVFNYWLSIRGTREFPPIRDLDPLELSDAGPFSILLEMIGGGDNADIRHFGQAIRGGVVAERLSDAPNPSLLSCIHGKLPIVAACRQALAFEESYETDEGARRCWVSLLPFSTNGTMVDFVYGFVTLDGEDEEAPVEASTEPVEASTEPEEVAAETLTVPTEPLDEEQETAEAGDPLTVPLEPLDEEPQSAEAADPFTVPLGPLDEDPEADSVAGPVEMASADPEESLPTAEVEPEFEPVEMTLDSPEEVLPAEFVPESEPEIEPAPEPAAEAPEAIAMPHESDFEEDEEPAPARAPGSPGFSARILEGLANFGGFYGQGVPVPPASPALDEYEAAEAEAPAEPLAEEQPPQPTFEAEGSLQSKLSDVRAKAEEARDAQIRSNMALIEGLSAAYDFALDAEQEPEEYLRLVEAQGMKIQLRSPMKPVVKLGFNDTFDDATIAQLEAVLAWALKNDLPRGSLADRIEVAGGIGAVLNG
jgi:hypothetical protein